MQGLSALQPKIQAWLGRLGAAADALVVAPSSPDHTDRATSRRWDAHDKIGIKVPLPGLEEPVVWLDTILPLVRSMQNQMAFYRGHSSPMQKPLGIGLQSQCNDGSALVGI